MKSVLGLVVAVALTLAGAVLVSGIVALTLSPMMCSQVLRDRAHQGRLATWLDRCFHWLIHHYRRLLSISLNHRGAVVLFAVAIIQTSGWPDDARQEGDFGMFAQDIEFKPDAFTASAGQIGLFIGNDDLVRHNISIDELEVDEELPSKAFVRIEFEAEAGTYEYYCTIHPTMVGSITVVEG